MLGEKEGDIFTMRHNYATIMAQIRREIHKLCR